MKDRAHTFNEKVIQLWDELSDLGAYQSDTALDYCMKSLCDELRADNAFWIGGVRVVKGASAKQDPMSGWRIGAVHLLNHDVGALERKKEVMKAPVVIDPGDTTVALTASAGVFRAHTLEAGTLLDLHAFKKTDHYDFFYRKRGIADRIWVVMPVSDDTESYFCFDTYKEGRIFSPGDLEIASQILRGIKWFHRQLLLSYGLGICLEPLTPSERRVKQGLLSGDSEKEIAAKLSLTPGTVHQYAVRIYRKFGVKGRAEFMSLWLYGCL